MLFSVSVTATTRKTVKQDVSIFAPEETAMESLKKRFMEIYPDAENIELVGDVGRSAKGKSFALLQAKISTPINEQMEVEAPDAASAIETVKEELGDIVGFSVREIHVIIPGVDFTRRRKNRVA